MNMICSHSHAVFFFFYFFLPVIVHVSISSRPPPYKHCYRYRRKKLFSFFASFFFPHLLGLKVVGSGISQWGILILSDLETSWLWELGSTELWLDHVGLVSPVLWILLGHFQKLHILAARQQKAPKDFLCSFIAGGRNKGIWACFPDSLV